MIRRLRKKMGQSTLEYAILIAIIVAGLLAMQMFVRKGYMGRLKQGAEGFGTQFSPGSVMDVHTITNATSRETMICGVTKSQSMGPELTTISGNYTTPIYNGEWTPGVSP